MIWSPGWSVKTRPVLYAVAVAARAASLTAAFTDSSGSSSRKVMSGRAPLPCSNDSRIPLLTVETIPPHTCPMSTALMVPLESALVELCPLRVWGLGFKGERGGLMI